MKQTFSGPFNSLKVSLSAPAAAFEIYMRMGKKLIKHEKKVRGWEEMASERYPLPSNASQLFLCFVFDVPLSFSTNHYVNAMRGS